MFRFVIFALSFSLAGAAAAESLAEIAAKEKERRAQHERTQGKTERVYTNDDLKTDKAEKSSGEGGAVSTAAASEKRRRNTLPEGYKGEIPADAAKNLDEGSWRSQAQQHRQAISSAQQRLQDLQSTADRLFFERLQSTDTYEILRLGNELQKVQEDIEKTKKTVADAQKGLEDFKKQAAQNDVPADWLSEPH
jgi:hypothetical protein